MRRVRIAQRAEEGHEIANFADHIYERLLRIKRSAGLVYRSRNSARPFFSQQCVSFMVAPLIAGSQILRRKTFLAESERLYQGGRPRVGWLDICLKTMQANVGEHFCNGKRQRNFHEADSVERYEHIEAQVGGKKPASYNLRYVDAGDWFAFTFFWTPLVAPAPKGDWPNAGKTQLEMRSTSFSASL